MSGSESFLFQLGSICWKVVLISWFFVFRKRRTLTSIISIPVAVLDLDETEPTVKGVNSSLQCSEHLDFLLALINSFPYPTNVYKFCYGWFPFLSFH